MGGTSRELELGERSVHWPDWSVTRVREEEEEEEEEILFFILEVPNIMAQTRVEICTSAQWGGPPPCHRRRAATTTWLAETWSTKIHLAKSDRRRRSAPELWGPHGLEEGKGKEYLASSRQYGNALLGVCHQEEEQWSGTQSTHGHAANGGQQAHPSRTLQISDQIRSESTISKTNWACSKTIHHNSLQWPIKSFLCSLHT